MGMIEKLKISLEEESEDIQQRIDWFNKEERKDYRSNKVKEVVEGIKDFGVGLLSHIVPHSVDPIKRAEKELDKATTALYKDLYKQYLSRIEEFPEGKIKREILSDGSERNTVYTENGSIEKTQFSISEEEAKNYLVSCVNYEGLSLVDVNGKGKSQLVYSNILVKENSIYPNYEISGTMRDEKGKFTNFNFNSNYRSLPALMVCREVAMRLGSLENTFNDSYDLFALNSDNIIDTSKPSDETEESEVDDNKANVVEMKEETQPKSFAQMAVDKVKEFLFSPTPDNDFFM